MPQATSVTFIIPALNEEHNLALAIDTARRIGRHYFEKIEILVFNDGSTDATGQIAERLATQHSDIRTFHHEKPINLGGCYKKGVKEATGDFIMMIPGDNECGENVLHTVFMSAGEADIIIPYTDNPEVRPPLRRFLSRSFVSVLNILSGERLRYYNGAVLHRSKIIKQCPIVTDSFGYQAEALVKLLRQGHTYKEVPIQISHRAGGKTKAFRLRNLLDTASFLYRLASS